MKVSELIEMLKYCDKDMDVHFSYNAGDYWRTEVAATVDSVNEGYVEYSDYHSMDKVVADEDDCYDEEGEVGRRVVILC